MMKLFIEIQIFLLTEKGASAVEYALLAALIGAATLGAQTSMGNAVVQMYQGAVGILNGAMS